MDWMNQLGGLLQQYTGAGRTHENPEQDFDEFARVAPRETPPFPNMLGQMFGGSSGMDRSNILSTLAAAVGPQVLASVLGRQGGGLGNLVGMFGGGGQISAEDADRIPPEAVQELAAEAQKRDPTIIDRVSDFYAEHPTLVKGLGAAALAFMMSNLANKNRGAF
jgi:hypothetical protein